MGGGGGGREREGGEGGGGRGREGEGGEGGGVREREGERRKKRRSVNYSLQLHASLVATFPGSPLPAPPKERRECAGGGQGSSNAQHLHHTCTLTINSPVFLVG